MSPCAVLVAGWEHEGVRCHGAEWLPVVLGYRSPSILLAGGLYWDSRAANFASPVLQLPWEDLVHERKLNKSGLKQGAKSEDCNRPLCA